MVQQEIRSGHPYFMYDAICSQPSAIARVLEVHSDSAREVAARLAEVRHLYLVGIGTSWHAALVAEHWFRHFSPSKPVVEAWHSFEFVSYPPPLNADSAVIVISHRGTKRYSYEALEMAKKRRALTVAISSTNPGPRIKKGDILLQTVEQERSAAFTVSYTTALTMLGMLAANMAAVRGDAEGPAELRQLSFVPSAIAEVLELQDQVKQAAQRFRNRKRFLFTGWGPNTATAYEAALKMKETSYTSTEGFQVEQILHGPFVGTDRGCMLTLIAPLGPGHQRSVDIGRAAKELGVPVWSLVQEDDRELNDLSAEFFAMGDLPELWTPLVYVVPLQLFTYFIALHKECNPDVFHQDDPRHIAARRHYSL